jgi:epoxyqueuosine reductase
LVSQQLGNWFFLGSIFTTIELPFDEPEIDHCGSCRKCLDICPTNAFPSPYTLDARRCISYLTIEHDGPVDEEFRPLIGNRIYGCDDCLAVCPWNKFAKTASESGYISREELMAPELRELVTLSDNEFRSFFKKSPIKRIGRSRFVRNVLYAIGNSENIELIPYLRPFLRDEDLTLRDAANWAFERLRK